MRGGAGERAQLDTENIEAIERQADAAHAQERVGLSVERQAGNRLVAARIQRADGDRLSSRPIEDPPISFILRLLIRQSATAEQQFGAHQADAVADHRIEIVEFGRVGDVDHDRNASAIRGHRGLAEISLGSPARGICLGRMRRKLGSLSIVRAQYQPAECAVHGADPVTVKIERPQSHDHGNPASPGKHRHMAGGAARHQRYAATAPPIGFEKPGGRQLLADQNGARRRRLRGPARAQATQDAITQILEIRRPGSKILLPRSLVIGDLTIESRLPSGIRWCAVVDCRKRRLA